MVSTVKVFLSFSPLLSHIHFPFHITDINECLTNNGGCAKNVTCTNEPGGNTCGTCPTGYGGDGHYCAGNDTSIQAHIYTISNIYLSPQTSTSAKREMAAVTS